MYFINVWQKYQTIFLSTEAEKNLAKGDMLVKAVAISNVLQQHRAVIFLSQSVFRFNVQISHECFCGSNKLSFLVKLSFAHMRVYRIVFISIIPRLRDANKCGQSGVFLFCFCRVYFFKGQLCKHRNLLSFCPCTRKNTLFFLHIDAKLICLFCTGEAEVCLERMLIPFRSSLYC